MSSRSEISPATQEKIFDAAERLFAERGFDGTSLREITTEAGVNLAAVNYHFGSKEDLYRETFLRRMRPMNELRHRLLDQAEQISGDRRVPTRTALDILFRPILSLSHSGSPGVHPFVRCMARNFIDPQPFMQAVVQ